MKNLLKIVLYDIWIVNTYSCRFLNPNYVFRLAFQFFQLKLKKLKKVFFFKPLFEQIVLLIPSLLNNFFSKQVRTIFETKYHNDFSCRVMYQFKKQGKDIVKFSSVELDWLVVLKKKNEIKSLLWKKIASSTCFKVRYECAYYMSARRGVPMCAWRLGDFTMVY